MLSNLKNKISKLSILLSGSIIVLAIYAVNISIKYNKLSNVFQIESHNLKKEIDEIIADYDEIDIEDNTNLSKEIKQRRNSVVSLKKSIANINTNNYSSLNNYRKKIRFILKQNRKLFSTIDSLQLSKELSEKNNIYTSLSLDHILHEHDTCLESDVTATVTPRVKYSGIKYSRIKSTKRRFLKTSPTEQDGSLSYKRIRVESLKKDEIYNNYIPTYKFDKVSAFKVSFEILENHLAKAGKKKIYIQVIDENEEIIRPISSFKFHGVSTLYTDCFTIKYHNENLSVSSLLKFDKGTFKEGNYLLVIYIEDEFVCNRIITLS